MVDKVESISGAVGLRPENQPFLIAAANPSYIFQVQLLPKESVLKLEPLRMEFLRIKEGDKTTFGFIP